MDVQYASFTTFFVLLVHLCGILLAAAALRSLWRSRATETLAIPLCCIVVLLTLPITISLVVLIAIGWSRWSQWVTQWFM